LELSNYFQKLIFNQQTAAPQKVPHWARSLQSPSLATPLVLHLVHQPPLREFVLSGKTCGLITEAKCWSRMWKPLSPVKLLQSFPRVIFTRT